MTYAEMKAMELLSSVHMEVEDLHLIIQRVPHGWVFVYHKVMGISNVTAIGTLFVEEKTIPVGHYEGPKHG